MPPPLRALTILQPYASAIIHGPKRCENRRWSPKIELPAWIAVHAGRPLRDHFDAVAAEWDGMPDNLPSGAIIGAMRVIAVETLVYSTREEPRDPWAFGPKVWIIDRVWPLDAPVECRGSKGLWVVDDETAETVRRAARRWMQQRRTTR